MIKNKQKITIIVPAYNEEMNILLFYEENRKIIRDLDVYNWEFVFVDDGSSDGTWNIIEKISNKDSHVKGVRLSRHFGKEVALTAGVESAVNPDAVILMDADLQHPPAVVPELIKQWELGFQIVNTQRKSIKYSFLRETGSRLFYFMLNKFSTLDIQSKATDFRLLDREVLKILKTFSERNRFFRGIVDWMGFKKTSIMFDSPKRNDGESTFSFRELFALAINSFTSFSMAPLRLTGYLGLVVTTIVDIHDIFTSDIRTNPFY